MLSYAEALTVSDLQSLQNRRIMAYKRPIISLKPDKPVCKLVSSRTVGTQYNYALRPKELKKNSNIRGTSTIRFKNFISFKYALCIAYASFAIILPLYAFWLLIQSIFPWLYILCYYFIILCWPDL